MVPPTVGRAGGRGYDRALQLASDSTLRQTFEGHAYWRTADVRGSLRATCGHACAYCGDQIGRTGEDVEHFRPKIPYWFLAYSFDNYLSSCRRCNSSRKGNKFPLMPGASRAQNVAQLGVEMPALLDPAHDDVLDALQIECSSGRYHWVPNPNAPANIQTRAKTTIEFFHLNRDAELVRARANAIAEFLVNMVDGGAEVRERTRRSASRFCAFGSAIRSVVQQQSPSLLPSPLEEAEWFLIEQLTTLTLCENDTATRDILLHAAAAMVVSPPPGLSRKHAMLAVKRANRWSEVRPLTKVLLPTM